MAKRVLIVLVLAAVAMAFKLSQRGDASDDVLNEIKALIEDLDVYAENSEYLDDQLDHAHMIAFDKAYELGGRRRSADFNEEAYLDALFSTMLKDCHRRKKTDVCEALEQLRAEIILVPEE